MNLVDNLHVSKHRRFHLGSWLSQMTVVNKVRIPVSLEYLEDKSCCTAPESLCDLTQPRML